MPIIFANIAWSNSYQKLERDEFYSNANHYVLDEFAELFNFASKNGRFYGYVPNPPTWHINPSSLGGNGDDKFVEGVTVIWTAPHPKQNGRVIVGWYQNATVYKEYDKRPGDLPLDYICEAKTDNCVLLPISERNFRIPTNYRYIWYAKGNEQLKENVLTYIKQYNENNPNQIITTENMEEEISGGGGGEGEDHKLLKEWVATNPDKIGIKNVEEVFIEYPFISGDRVDILFKLRNNNYAVVEIETNIPFPGCHQALKYKILKCAEIGVGIQSKKVSAYVIAWRSTKDSKQFCKKYGINFIKYKL